MTVRDVTLLLAMLAVIAEAAVVLALVVTVGARWSSGLATLRRRLVDTFGPVALELALGVALVATLGSLYLSEVANFVPCRLCWYQRIAMYPLVPVLAVAVRRHDYGARFYALPLAAIGGGIAAYHVLVERYPSLEGGVRGRQPLHADLGAPVRLPDHPHHGAVGVRPHRRAPADLRRPPTCPGRGHRP
ncbi:MAG TPA: disulfide bond formation protein B [Acidimicrobiales bacterium]|nr:disulfide bond formation protein B [Acidimicrobiales bacterium]